MKILILGAGMYVTGRGGHGHGVLLASLIEVSRKLPVEAITIAATNPDNEQVVQEASLRLNQTMGLDVPVTYHRLTHGDITKEADSFLQSFDAAIVCVPDHLHYAATKVLLAHKLPTLVVKPFTSNLEEATILCGEAEKAGVYGAVEFHKRFDQSNLYAKRAVSEGWLGNLLYSEVRYSQRRVIPLEVFKDWSQTTNIFQYLAVHYVDMLWFLTGFMPVRAMATGTREFLVKHGINTWDSIHATIEWRKPNGAVFNSQFNVNWIDSNNSTAMSQQELLLVGSEGRLNLDQCRRGIHLVQEKSGVNEANPYFAEFLPAQDDTMHFTGYGHESISQFMQDVAAIKSGNITPKDLEGKRPTFRQALVSSAVIDAVNKSLNSNSAWQEVEHV